MAQEQETSTLADFSDALAAAVERAAGSVVRVDDGTRLTATGVVWQEDGVIVTTSHSVERDEEIVIETGDGVRHEATLIGRDSDTDLAVLRVGSAAGGLSPIERVDTENVKVGQIALAVARPGEAGLQATVGIVSARRDTETNGSAEYILQTDAALYPGFSGGPLINAHGQMLGLTNRMYGRGLGVVVGTPLVERVVEAILTHGQVKRGYLGVRTQLVPLPASLRSSLGLAQEFALLVVQVETGSPAEQAGLLMGDTLLRLNGETVQDVDELRRHLNASQPVTLQIARGGALAELSATVGAGRE